MDPFVDHVLVHRWRTDTTSTGVAVGIGMADLDATNLSLRDRADQARSFLSRILPQDRGAVCLNVVGKIITWVFTL